MKKPVDFQDASGLRIVIVEQESGGYAFKTYYNNIKVDLSLYEFNTTFLTGLQKAIGEFLEN